MVKIKINKSEINVPQSWNELDKYQLLDFIRIIYLDSKDGNFSDVERLHKTKIEMLLVLLRQTKYFLKIWERDCKYKSIFLGELNKVLKLTEPFFEKVEGEDKDGNPQVYYTAKYDLTDNVLKFFRKGLVSYYGPGELLNDITFDEFMLADLKFEHYLKYKKESDLDELVAVLYRKKKNVFGKKVEYDADKVDAMKEQFKDLPKEIKFAVFHYYTSCRQFLTNFFDKVFKVAQATEEKNNDASGWFDVKFHIAGTKFGSFQEVGKTKMFVILKHLQMLEAQREHFEMQKAIQAARR